VRHGQGDMAWIDGAVYVGEWKNDERHGEGTMTTKHTHMTPQQQYSCSIFLSRKKLNLYLYISKKYFSKIYIEINIGRFFIFTATCT
jgi:hypothetical protein